MEVELGKKVAMCDLQPCGGQLAVPARFAQRLGKLVAFELSMNPSGCLLEAPGEVQE